jgi:hypothetical protein
MRAATIAQTLGASPHTCQRTSLYRGSVQTKSFQTRKLLLLLAALSLSAVTQAQNLYKVNFKGAVTGVDSAGTEFSQALNNKTLIQSWAARVGISNHNNLILAYRLNADRTGGDTIEVINKKDGTPAVVIFPMASPEAASATTAKGITQKRFVYVYDIYQPGVSMGTAILNERTSLNKNGSTNRVVLDGDLQWYWYPDNTTNALRIGTGRFNVTGKPLTFKGN